MTHQCKRCGHCNSPYTYQGSGHGCFHKENDERFCPDCMKVINAALDKVPLKFKDTWIETNEVTYDQLKQWEQDKITEHNTREENGELLFPIGKRVLAGCYNLETGEKDVIEHVDGRDDFRGREYIYRYWSGTPDQITITTRVEKNIETGETTPWTTYR